MIHIKKTKLSNDMEQLRKILLDFADHLNTYEGFEEVRFDFMVVDYLDKLSNSPKQYIIDDEPYMGWCNVESCNNEASSGGIAWMETGYWTVCHKHSADYRAGKPQPKMKQKYIDREKNRLPDGTLPK